jgi:allantoinase
MPDLIIRNGAVVTPAKLLTADIAIEAGRITHITPELQLPVNHEIDAKGLTIFPGLIDAHVHFNEPGRTDWEGASTGSKALAAGGGTTFFDMPLNSAPCTVTPEAFDAKRAALEQASITDFALWGGIVPNNYDSLQDLAERGVIGFKAFMSDSGLPEFPRADDLTLYEGMCEAARLHLPVAVHAESEEITRGLSERARQLDRHGIREYLDSRPVIAELEAIRRATFLAREAGASLHVVHVSSGSGIALALEARAQGTDVSIETCAHYLYFTEEDVERIGAAAKCAPPLRSAKEQASLWHHVLHGHVDLITSDHSPAPLSMKQGDDFFRIWGGIAGVQSTLPVLLDKGRKQGLHLPHIAFMTADSPARRFRILGKGRIEVGYDADLIFVDLDAATTLQAEDLLQRHAISPYIGATFKGAIRRTMLRGETIFDAGRITASRSGVFLRPEKIESWNS